MAYRARRPIRGTVLNLLWLLSLRILYNNEEVINKISLLGRVLLLILFQAYILGKQVEQVSRHS